MPSNCSLTAALLLTVCSYGCGYHVAGKANALPSTIHTLAVPAFRNETPRFKVEQFLTTAVVRELLARTRYRVQSEPEESDAVLRGVVTGFYTVGVFDPVTNRATTGTVNVRLRVSLVDSKTNKVLWENRDYLYTEPYEISQQTSGYFEESDASLQRLSRTVAAAVVSAILEKF